MKPITRWTMLGALAAWTTTLALPGALGQAAAPPVQGPTVLPLPLGFTYETVRSFGFPERSGVYPWANVLQGSDGLLYGTTVGDGSRDRGTIFKLNPDGSGYSVLKHFDSSGADGAEPVASLVQDSEGTLYGTTAAGGPNGAGTVFKLQPDGSGYTVLKSFSHTGDEAYHPLGALMQGSDGTLYGTTDSGGTADKGTVFKLQPDGSGYSVLKSFGTSADDGIQPWYGALLQGRDGALYGTTVAGGTASYGTVFKLNPNTGDYAVLKSFSWYDGVYPYAGLVQDSDGALYGTTTSGGYGSGTVFELNPETGGYAVLKYFYGSDGAAPHAALMQGSDRTLYGTTSYGGAAYCGTVFSLNLNTGAYLVLKSFGAQGGDGNAPDAALVLGRDGMLYGTTYAGGTAGCGTVFKLKPDGNDYTVVWSFSSWGGDGYRPLTAPLIQGRDGALYGTTLLGGTANNGTVFQFKPDTGDYTVLKSFGTAAGDGTLPRGPLVQDRDGTLYGTTVSGGTNGAGTVFKLQPDGTGYSVLKSFGSDQGDGTLPYAGVVQASDGTLYGTTESGGEAWGGTVFKLNPYTGEYAVLKSFGAAESDGTAPEAGLVLGGDGMLYGTALRGGTNGGGTVFKLNPATRDYTVLQSFGASWDDGYYPDAALVQGRDGALYGTTFYGGANGYGTVFKLNPNGSGYTLLRSFVPEGGDGYWPEMPLLQGSDGALYGATQYGGTASAGTVFKLNPDGTGYTVLMSFGTVAGDGTQPCSALVQASDGAFYGTTTSGGDMNLGTVFRLTPPPRLDLQGVLNDATTLCAGVTNRNDAHLLDKAIGPLTAALAPSGWLDDSHLVATQGKLVFDDLKDVVCNLALPERTVPAATLQDLLNRVFRAARQLATTEIADATVAQGNARKLSDAQNLLAQADVMLAGGKPKEALVCLKNAWDKAATSMH